MHVLADVSLRAWTGAAAVLVLMVVATLLARLSVKRRGARGSARYAVLANMYQSKPWEIAFGLLWTSPLVGYLVVRLAGGSMEAAAFGALVAITAGMATLIVAASAIGYLKVRKHRTRGKPDDGGRAGIP